MGLIQNLLNVISYFLLPFSCLDPLLQSKLANTKFDFIVVGGGSAGSVVASRLSENPKVNVLLLEAGGCPPVESAIPIAGTFMYATSVDWTFLTTPQKDSFLSYPNNTPIYHSGKVVGGGSVINDMMYIRGSQSNYDSWAALENLGWSYAEVLPYFLKSEDNTITGQSNDTTYHNTSGPQIVSQPPYSNQIQQAFLNGAKLNGLPITDINLPEQTGASPIPFTLSNGARWSTYDAFLKPAKSNNQNLVIAANALVTKVMFSNTNPPTVTGVQFTMNNKVYTVSASKEVILSAGAISSPKILMLSGIGPKAQLQQFNIPVVQDLPGVGQKLQDHAMCGILNWKVSCTDCTLDFPRVTTLQNTLDWFINRQGPQTVPETLEGVAFLKTKYAETSANDIQLVLITGNMQGPKEPNITMAFGLSTGPTSVYFGPWGNELTFSIFPIAIAPKSRGSVTLQSADPNQQPNIDLNFFSDPNDIKVLREGVKAALAIVDSPAFKDFGAELNPVVYPGCEGYTQYTDEYWECTCRQLTITPYHPAGTCVMGKSSDPMAVVNAQLQVYKVNNLRVIDNSIMPLVTAGNTNAPAIMIGEKGADMIKKAYGL